MTMNLAQARGGSRISNNPSYRPYQKALSPTTMAKKDKKIREASSAKVKCRRGYVEMNGRCLPQEERNKKNNQGNQFKSC